MPNGLPVKEPLQPRSWHKSWRFAGTSPGPQKRAEASRDLLRFWASPRAPFLSKTSTRCSSVFYLYVPVDVIHGSFAVLYHNTNLLVLLLASTSRSASPLSVVNFTFSVICHPVPTRSLVWPCSPLQIGVNFCSPTHERHGKLLSLYHIWSTWTRNLIPLTRGRVPGKPTRGMLPVIHRAM